MNQREIIDAINAITTLLSFGAVNSNETYEAAQKKLVELINLLNKAPQ